MKIKARIQEAVARALTELGISTTSDSITLEHPAELSHGDYATNVALQYAKQAARSPRDLAVALVSAMGAIAPVAKIDIAGPGFINFTLSSGALSESLDEALVEDRWGDNTVLEGQNVIIEYTSPNLFKPLHIGNLVGNVLGESISRLIQCSGAIVKRVNYPSDIGLTVAKGVWGLQKTHGDPADILSLGEAYRVGNESYETDIEAKAQIETINKKLYEGSDTELNALRETGINTSRAHLDDICKKLGTTFDLEIFESEAAPVGRDIVLAHIDDGIFEKSDGAIIFPETHSGVHTRVFINSLGLPTYEAKDLGNFTLKNSKYPEWTHYLVVTGVEQKEYFQVVFKAIQKIFPNTQGKTLRHVANGFLTPTTGKMSSRKGNVITGESLIADVTTAAKRRATESRADDVDKLAEQIAVAAIKYQILKQSSGKNIIFDRERSLSLEGDSGPYLQYTYARTNAIIAKAHEQGIKSKFNTDTEPNEVARLLHRFPEIVEHAAKELEPHIVAQYLLLIASAFNTWYAHVHILDGTSEASHKVAITVVVNKTLKNGLWILGIPAPDRM
jgi:arginyl-tRNA synthetase